MSIRLKRASLVLVLLLLTVSPAQSDEDKDQTAKKQSSAETFPSSETGMPAALPQSESDSAKDSTTAPITNNTSTANQIPLQGGVQVKAPAEVIGKMQAMHINTAEPVAGFLRGGVKFDGNAITRLEALEPNNYWFRIPSWMIGTWSFKERHVSSKTNLQTGQIDNHEHSEKFEYITHWGYQQDSTGAYWQFENTPFTNHALREQSTVYFIGQKNEPVGPSDVHLTCRQFFTSVIVDNVSQTLIHSGQSEQLATFTALGGDQIRRDVSIKYFDEAGKPLNISTEWMLGTRTAPYHAINNDQHGRDLRALFREYLNSHGLSYLVPN